MAMCFVLWKFNPKRRKRLALVAGLRKSKAMARELSDRMGIEVVLEPLGMVKNKSWVFGKGSSAAIRATVLMFALAAMSSHGADALSDVEVEEVRTLHRERLAGFIAGVGGDALTYPEKEAIAKAYLNTSVRWIDCSDSDKKAVMVKKMKSDQAFQEKVQKAYDEWTRRNK
jgi:hypothetical protein